MFHRLFFFLLLSNYFMIYVLFYLRMRDQTVDCLTDTGDFFAECVSKNSTLSQEKRNVYKTKIVLLIVFPLVSISVLIMTSYTIAVNSVVEIICIFSFPSIYNLCQCMLYFLCLCTYNLTYLDVRFTNVKGVFF